MNERDELYNAIQELVCMGTEFEGSFGSDVIIRGFIGYGDACYFTLKIEGKITLPFMIYNEDESILYLDTEWADYSIAEYAVGLLVKQLAYGCKITIKDLPFTKL